MDKLQQKIKILTIGDIVGPIGCNFLKLNLPEIKKNNQIDVVIANGENSTTCNGVSHAAVKQIMASGVDVITTGNHAFKNYQAENVFKNNPFVLRPANFHKSLPGAGVFMLDKGTYQVFVINLIGNAFMPAINKNLFDAIDNILEEYDHKDAIILVDFHAETSAEKKAMAFYVDGRISVLVGTHTHIQTADEQILPKGTAYITDLGMTGPNLSVLGIKPDLAIKKQITSAYTKFELSDSPCEICGLIIDVSLKTRRATNVKRFKFS